MKVPLKIRLRGRSQMHQRRQICYIFLETQDNKMKFFYLQTQVMLNYILIKKSKHNTE